jgi:hypothetical protein
MTHNLGLSPIGGTRCSECGVQDPAPESTCYPRRKKPCAYLGPEVAIDGCETCGAGVGIKVFACDIYTRCTLETETISIKQVCSKCSAYEAALA